MTLVNVALILACIAIGYFVCHYCRRIFFDKKEMLPGPGLMEILEKICPANPDEILDVFNLLTTRYPSPFKIVTSYSSVIIYEPNQVKTILQSQHCLEKNILYKFLKPTVNMGLITAPVSVWTQCRKIIAPSFRPIILQEFFDTFVEQSLILTNKLEKVALNGNKITFLEHIKECVMDIAFGTVMNIKLESNKKDEYMKAFERQKNIFTRRICLVKQNIFLYFDFIFNLTTLGHEQQKTVQLMKSVTKEIIQQQHKFNKLSETETNASHKTFIHNLMDKLQKKNKNLKEKLIYDNINSIIIASFDTISTTINFAIFMLANFPEIQEKVYKELVEIYGTETPTSAPVKYNDLQHMHYLDRVIKETLRLFPPLPVIGRQLTESMKIGKYILPKKSNVIIPFMGMYRKEEYWPDPLKFDPDRFLPERIKDHHSYYYIPFSDGPRNCIGMRYAMISIKVILATLVRTFVFKVDKSIQIDEIRLKINMSLSPIKPLEVKIEKRDP